MKYQKYISKIKNILTGFLTFFGREPKISKTCEITTPPKREIKTQKTASKSVMDSLKCPYCFSTKFVRRGWRQKKRERVQLYLCQACGKTFTSQKTKGKHYPLSVMLDAVSLYHLGYSLEESCRIINIKNQKLKIKNTEQKAKIDNDGSEFPSVTEQTSFISEASGGASSDPSRGMISTPASTLSGDGLSTNIISPKVSSATPLSNYQSNTESANMSSAKNPVIQPSTLSNWLSETAELCRFSRMREYALKKYRPREMVLTATLAHRQLYRYRFHQAKCRLIIEEEYQHRRFRPLQEFLEMVPGECPHQYFQEGLRASEAPLTFSKKQMIVRAKQNYATRLCEFVLQSVKERKARHEALQKFMLCNDSVTVATEVPVYITGDDLEHMQTQLGFQLYIKNQKSNIKDTNQISKIATKASQGNTSEVAPPLAETPRMVEELASESLPKLITGHIDILQIRNGQAHILDYKPRAERERPIEQLTLYAMALSRLTGLRLFEFKCAWFDERDYFEFYPLHVLHKPRKNRRRRKVYTMEGIYKINRDAKKIEEVRPYV